MDFLLFDIFFSLIGRGILYAWFRNQTKVKYFLKINYDDSFVEAGRHFTVLFSVGLLFLFIIFITVKEILQLLNVFL